MRHHRPYRTVEQQRANEAAWLAIVSGAFDLAARPMLPEGYRIDLRDGDAAGVFRGRRCHRLVRQYAGALGVIIGEYATEAEAIEAAHEDDDEQRREHECDCGAIVTGPGSCARCIDRQHDERGDW